MMDVVLNEATHLHGAVDSSVKACDVLALLSLVSAGVVAPFQLMNAVVARNAAQKAFRGTSLWKPKYRSYHALTVAVAEAWGVTLD
eukprot:6290382-Pyramimonas_sp.AAC.1